MMDRAFQLGAEQALAKFGIKEASIADAARLGVIGRAPEVFVQGAHALGPGGPLHWQNVLWPSVPGSRAMTWIGRAGTLAMLPALPSMMRADAHEGTLSRVLGGVGGLAGMLYGGTAGGMLGAPVGGAVGRSLGHGIGHLLGSRPRSPYQ